MTQEIYFFKLQSASILVISNHNSFGVQKIDKIVSVYFIRNQGTSTVPIISAHFRPLTAINCGTTAVTVRGVTSSAINSEDNDPVYLMVKIGNCSNYVTSC